MLGSNYHSSLAHNLIKIRSNSKYYVHLFIVILFIFYDFPVEFYCNSTPCKS